MKMQNLVPIVNVAEAHNVSTQELISLVKSMKLTLFNLENIFLVNAAEFDFLHIADDIFLPNKMVDLDALAAD